MAIGHFSKLGAVELISSKKNARSQTWFSQHRLARIGAKKDSTESKVGVKSQNETADIVIKIW